MLQHPIEPFVALIPSFHNLPLPPCVMPYLGGPFKKKLDLISWHPPTPFPFFTSFFGN
jgi:hypothetical protein